MARGTNDSEKESLITLTPEPAANLLPDLTRPLAAAAQSQLLTALPGVATCRTSRIRAHPTLRDP
jgi:hypothetical protein